MDYKELEEKINEKRDHNMESFSVYEKGGACIVHKADYCSDTDYTFVGKSMDEILEIFKSRKEEQYQTSRTVYDLD